MVTAVVQLLQKQKQSLVELYFIGSSTIGWNSEKQRSREQMEYESKPINENMKCNSSYNYVTLSRYNNSRKKYKRLTCCGRRILPVSVLVWKCPCLVELHGVNNRMPCQLERIVPCELSLSLWSPTNTELCHLHDSSPVHIGTLFNAFRGHNSPSLKSGWVTNPLRDWAWVPQRLT